MTDSKRCTVKELIEALQKLNPSLAVFTPGYEGGYHDATQPSGTGVTLRLNVNDESYYGPHDMESTWNTNKWEDCEEVEGYILR